MNTAKSCVKECSAIDTAKRTRINELGNVIPNSHENIPGEHSSKMILDNNSNEIAYVNQEEKKTKGRVLGNASENVLFDFIGIPIGESLNSQNSRI